MMRREIRLMKKSYWTSFFRHVRKTLEKSAIGGVPQIVAANNPILKMLRAAVFFCCLFGFLYQFFTFLELYWAYPIVMDVQVKSPSRISIPAFTICDHNGYTMKDYCAISKQKCVPVLNETSFCYARRRYCSRRKLPPGFVFPPDESLVISETMNERDAAAIPQVPQNHTIRNCEMLSSGDTPTIACPKARRAPYTKGDIETRTNCFMLNSIWNLPGASIRDMASTDVINLLLLTNKTDYFTQIEDRFVAMYIDFHSPMALANPILNGFVMYPGMRYKFYIKERILNLLPAPYITNCTDYLTEWKKNGNKGPVSQGDCIEFCKLELIRKERGCVDFFNSYPHNEPLCDTGCTDFVCSNGYKDVDGMSESLIRFGKICTDKCRPGCDQKVYEVSKEEIQVPEEIFQHIPNRRSWKEYIYVRLSFDKFDITTYSYTPKFELIETFCYLGGYVGIWLGISLVAIFDFVESIIIILKHPYRRMRNKFHKKINPTSLPQREKPLVYY